MVNNRNINIHQQNMENTSPASVAPQKQMEKLRILSNVKVPLPEQWQTNNSGGYFTEEYKTNCQQQSKNMTQVSNTVDIIDEALSAAINEEEQRHMMDEISTYSVPESLLQALSPWEIEDAPEVKWVTCSKEKNAKKRRPSLKEGPSKKQKNREASNQLKSLLLQCDIKKEKNKRVEINEPVIILSGSNTDDQEDMRIFSQDTDMNIFKQAIELKKNLIAEKETAEREFNVCECEINELREKLAAAENKLITVRARRDSLTKKVNWVLKSL